MAAPLKSLLDGAEELIIQGRIKEAGLALSQLETERLPRSQIARTAGLLRRTGRTEDALRLLTPVVRPEARLVNPATQSEILEYAIGLQKNGSVDEARELLAQVDPIDKHEVLLYRAIFHFPDWEYDKAIPHLQELLRLESPDSYLHQVAQLNLAAALVTVEDYAAAAPILKRLRQETAARGHSLLHCNALEVAAQAAIFARDFKSANDCLTNAESILTGVKTFEHLWLVKWRSVLSALETRKPEHLDVAYEEARRKNHWETLRELDFVRCQITHDPQLALKIYYGSAAKAYRERVKRHVHVPSVDRLFIGRDFSFYADTPASKHLLFDFAGQLSPGKLPHVILMNLCSDAYREFRPGQLYSRLFPREHFNPYTSPDRLHQLMKRLRSELKQQMPGARLIHANGYYKVDLNDLSFCLETLSDFPPLDVHHLRLHHLTLKLNSAAFDCRDIQNVFSLSRAAANRLIQTWKDNATIEESGRDGRIKRFKISRAA